MHHCFDLTNSPDLPLEMPWLSIVRSVVRLAVYLVGYRPSIIIVPWNEAWILKTLESGSG